MELDGFGKHKVLTIGATNNADMLDKALLRPGRFDRQIEVPLPNLDGREAILSHYLKKIKADPTVNALEIARMTVWKSGADIANIVNEAGLFAIRDGRAAICQTDLVKSIQRNSFGMSYSRKILLEELKETAWHEAGHALVAYFRNKHDRLQVLTIVPSSYALGYAWYVGKDDVQISMRTKRECLIQIETCLGSYVAEMMYMGTTSRGVSMDLKMAASTASDMIRKWGMGEFKFNTSTAFGDNGGSEATEREIELQIKEIIDLCMENVKQLLHGRKRELELIANALVEKETLYYRDLVAILEPQKTADDIEVELAQMGARKLVGEKHYIDLNALRGRFGGTPESTNFSVDDNE